MLQDDHRALAIYYQLIYDLLIFVRPFLRSADLHKQPGTTLYRGTRKLFLQMFHEHVEFLTLFSYHFLTHIPPNCMQLRNIVLSAAPRRIPLPDPFTTSVKFKELKDATGTPQVLLEVGKTLHRIRARAPLMKYLRTREPSDFRSRLLWCLEVRWGHYFLGGVCNPSPPPNPYPELKNNCIFLFPTAKGRRWEAIRRKND